MAARSPLSRTTRSGFLGARFRAALFCSMASFALAGCQRELGAELLEVNAVVPAEAQFGDAVQIIGDGFGLGSPASVTWCASFPITSASSFT